MIKVHICKSNLATVLEFARGMINPAEIRAIREGEDYTYVYFKGIDKPMHVKESYSDIFKELHLPVADKK